MKLVLATRNKYKIAELKSFLQDLLVEVLTLNDVANAPALVEDGTTFQENAVKKARTVHQFTGLPALADDSGLEVFFLNGRPGVYSARYTGEDATDEKNNRRLLAEMRGVPPRRRRAQFKAVLALAGREYVETADGICPGRIAEEPRGTNGFGYDPIFIPDGFDRTYAELTAEEKNTISHRARAFARMKEVLGKRLK